MANERKYFDNKNGNMEIIEFLSLIKDEEEYDKFLRRYTTTISKCPPFQLLELNTDCFRCISCWNSCKEKIKNVKDGFKYGNKKYTFEDVDNWILEKEKSALQKMKSIEE